MYGALIGDIVGSSHEFGEDVETKDFPLFDEDSSFTDDTVMTVAVAEALLESGKNASCEEIKNEVELSMQKWGRKYPNAGYGGSFICWLNQKIPKPYGSYGNGSAMRVSAAGWLYDSLERTREVVRATAEVTHNHPEGIKGAEAVASAIFLARNGISKEQIKKYIENEFQYNLNRSIEEIKPVYFFNEICQETVPEAIICFLESKNFEDAIRTAVYLGGDTDTLAAIAGSIAEAYFRVPRKLIKACGKMVDEEMLEILKMIRCRKRYGARKLIIK